MTAAAWLCIATADRTGDARFTAAFLLLGATVSVVALFCFLIERRGEALLALALSLSVPVATAIYVSRQTEGWLS